MATTPSSLFQDLRDALKEFKDFLDANVSKIKPAVSALKSLVPQITELLDKLIDLMNKLNAEIDKLNVNAIPGIAEASQFTDKLKTFLNTTKTLLPAEASTVDSVLQIADVVTSLPSLDSIKQEIKDLITAIVGHLNTLKTA
jgi:ABC-type transporter Mla subunit MlaD